MDEGIGGGRYESLMNARQVADSGIRLFRRDRRLDARLRRVLDALPCGWICFKGQKVSLSHAWQTVGVTQVNERIWLVTFMQYDLGYCDDETCRLEPIENPFGSKCSPCPRNELSPM